MKGATMKQKPVKNALIMFGSAYLVNAEEISPIFGKFYCFYCTSPMIYVCANESQKEHFVHDLTALTYQAADICPYLMPD
ncbi:DUF7828 domain-containing protein [Atlantibacter subterraneus]|uniref:DUF7828 domain-containing protein n=1 Tax=Atlantibacter subterraneus TaxID=255519 RepID=UPI00406AAC2D